MSPRLVTPPSGLPISVAAVKVMASIEHSHHDDLIEGLIKAATAWLDGWHGVLSRCILPQTWRVTVSGPGPHLLPLPDVSAAVSSSGEAVSLMLTDRGHEASAEGATGSHDLDFICGLPVERLPAAQQLIHVIVAGWYEGRLPVAGAGDGVSGLSPVQRALIAPLRWSGP